jgi:hypothetical protein
MDPRNLYIFLKKFPMFLFLFFNKQILHIT